MLTDPERFKHNKSSYERPTSKFRCGREVFWKKPCHQGPNSDGSCGGTTECSPIRNKKGRFECRRPSRSGGPCKPGPLPDGSCSQKHPPCGPKLAIRAKRERLALIWLLLVVATIGGLIAASRYQPGILSPIDPGPLSEKHAHFASEQGCTSCHAVHGAQPGEWLKGIFVKSNLSTQCLSCHSLGGPESKAHNKIFPDRTDLHDTSCIMCHTEHKGTDYDIRAMTAQECNICHSNKFKSFSDGHPRFSSTYPHDNRTPIIFDHAKHMNTHFLNRSVKDRAPENCLSCHSVSSALDRHVQTKGFEESCASCHTDDITKSSLVLFRSPELVRNDVGRSQVEDACGDVLRESAPAIGESGAPVESEEFESISFEEPTAISSFLLGVSGDDPEVYGKPMQQLMFAMAKKDVSAITKVVEKHSDDPDIALKLLAGLDPEVVKRAACVWLANEEYESPGEAEGGGWHADLLELSYHPMAHSDPVAKSWVEFSLMGTTQTTNENEQERAEDMRSEILSRKSGVGRCTKCHSVRQGTNEEGGTKLAAEWTYHDPRERDYTAYSHGAHLRLFGGGSEGCTSCHVMDANAKYIESFDSSDASSFQSNFKPIRKETCMQCHSEHGTQDLVFSSPMGEDGIGKRWAHVREDCLLCHSYHLKPSLNRSMLDKVSE